MDYKRLLSKTISINVSFLLLLQQSVIAGEIVTDINANSSFKFSSNSTTSKVILFECILSFAFLPDYELLPIVPAFLSPVQ